MNTKSTTAGLTPVTPQEAMQRVNAKLVEEGLHLREQPGGYCLCDESGAIHMADVCLDTEAINLEVLADNEFLCWPEEQGTKAVAL